MSETRDMIEQSIGRIFAAHVDRNLLDAAEAQPWGSVQRDLWDTVEQAGFADVLGAADRDGEGERAGAHGAGHDTVWSDAYPVFHALGRYRVPLPLAETALARALAQGSGLELEAPGPMTLAQIPSSGQKTVNASLAGGDLILSGTLQSVPWARMARRIVVAVQLDGRSLIGLIDPEQAGLTIEPGANLAGEPRDVVRLDACRCVSFAHADASLPLEPVAVCGALARAAMMAGAVESILAESVQYANERVQFGRPIGKFQAIQQSIAVLAGEATSAQCASAAGFEGARPWPGRFDAAVAKIRAGQAAGLAAGIAHQVHGAIGFTWEHTLHYATQRLWSWRSEFGAESAWAQELGHQAIGRGAARFWEDMTARQL
jgi:acyl-CoA dehydrogenase